MARACIGLGANLGDPPAQIEQALALIGAQADINVLSRSRLYRSPALDGADQPEYCNAAALLETSLTPQVLLERLLAIERLMGRERGARWAARTIDLDLLAYEQCTIASPGLTLPHPEMHRRAFVLVPLAEIAPDWLVPRYATVAALARDSDTRGLRLWVSS